MSDIDELDLLSEDDAQNLSLNLDDTIEPMNRPDDADEDADEQDIDDMLNNQSINQSNYQSESDESDPEQYEISQSINQFEDSRLAQFAYGQNPVFHSNPRIVINQSESARTSIKLLNQLIKEKSELDKYYAKSLKKIVERATINQSVPEVLPKELANQSINQSNIPVKINQSSQFDLLLTSFRQLTATLASNFDILSTMIDEKVQQSINQFGAHHSKESKRLTDEVNRLVKHMGQLNNELNQSNSQSKKACADFQAWKNEYERRRQEHLIQTRQRNQSINQSTRQSPEPGLFDVFASPFQWDFDSMKKKTLAVDNRYIQSVKAVRSFKPYFNQSITQLLNEFQSLEEQRRTNQLQSISDFLLIHGTMFEKAAKNVRHVTALGSQVKPKREVAQFSQAYQSINQPINQSVNPSISQSINQSTISSINHSASQSISDDLPIYVMHRGHPMFDDVTSVTELHSEDELINESVNQSANQSPESSEESSSESDTSSDDDSDSDRKSTASRQSINQSHTFSNIKSINQSSNPSAKLPINHRNHPLKKHTLDESINQKSDERIVAEKVLRVMIDKLTGRADQSVNQSIDDIERIVADQTDDLIDLPSVTQSVNQSTNQPISQPVSSLLTSATDQSANSSVDPSIHQSINQSTDQALKQAINQSSDQSINQSPEQCFTLTSEEEIAAKAIFGTRDGRLAFATVMASLSPSFTQSVNQSINSPINQSINSPINHSINQSLGQSTSQSMSLFFCMPDPESTLSQPLLSYSSQSITLSSTQFLNLSRLINFFLDASHAAYHCLPVIFVSQVAYEIVTPSNQLIEQSFNQSNTPAVNQSTSQPINQSNKISASRSVKQKPSNKLSNQSINQSIKSHSEREEVDEIDRSPHSLMRQLMVHPIFFDMKFYSEAFFDLLNAGFTGQSINQSINQSIYQLVNQSVDPSDESTNQSVNHPLILHPWYSDREVQSINQSRKMFTFLMLARFSVLMRICGVKRSLRRRFVDKQVRVLDLINQSINRSTNSPAGDLSNNQSINQSINPPNYSSQLRLLRSLNDRPSLTSSINQSIDDDDDDSPLAIDGLHELTNDGRLIDSDGRLIDFDSDEEAREALLKKKEEEKKLMQRRKRREEMKKLKEKQSINQSINQTNNQSNNQSINQSTNQPIAEVKRSIMSSFSSWFGSKNSNQSINQSTSQSINQSINQSGRSSPAITQPAKPLNQSIKPSSTNQSINQSEGVRLSIAIAQPVRSPQTSPINPVINQSINQSTNQPNQTINQSIDPSTNQSSDTTDQSLNQSLNQSVNQSSDSPMASSVDTESLP